VRGAGPAAARMVRAVPSKRRDPATNNTEACSRSLGAG
jgi:hypothetical protein